MKKKLLLFLAFSFVVLTNINAQFALGDIAFSAYNSETAANLPAGTNVDSFTIVLLRDVTAGEEISFTENGWFAAGGFRSGENTATLTFGSSYSEGMQIMISADPFVALDQNNSSAGTLTGNPLSLATGGDQIFAYNPSNMPTTGDESGFIAAIHMNGAWNADSTSSTTSAKPSVFTDGVNSISINPEVDNARLASTNCNDYTDVDSLRALLNDASKWETNNSVGYQHIPAVCDFLGTLSSTNFDISELSVFPNPAKNQLTIKSTRTNISFNNISIVNVTGNTVLKLKDYSVNNTIDVSSLSSGVYLLKIEVEGSSVIKKFVKN